MTGSQQPPAGPGLPGSGESPCGSASLDAPHRQRRMQALARGMDLDQEIEDLAEDWLDQVCGPDRSRHEAVLALLAGLRGCLDSPPGSASSRSGSARRSGEAATRGGVSAAGRRLSAATRSERHGTLA